MRVPQQKCPPCQLAQLKVAKSVEVQTKEGRHERLLIQEMKGHFFLSPSSLLGRPAELASCRRGLDFGGGSVWPIASNSWYPPSNPIGHSST